jgi:hypothetical protein
VNILYWQRHSCSFRYRLFLRKDISHLIQIAAGLRGILFAQCIYGKQQFSKRRQQIAVIRIQLQIVQAGEACPSGRRPSPATNVPVPT